MIVELAAAAADPGGCAWFDPGCFIGQAIETVKNQWAADIAAVFMNAWQQMEMWFFASWIAIPLLVDITDPNGTAFWLQETLSTITLFFAVLGALVTAGWTFIKLGPERVKNLGLRLSVLLLVSIAGAPIIAAADWLARQASIGLLVMVGIDGSSTLTNNTAILASPGIPFILGLLATLGLLIQWCIMLARGPLVVVLTGVWPLAAAAATLGAKKGEESFDKITSWLLAFVIYPFPAAIVYAAAFKLKTGVDGIGGIAYGFALEMLALFLLPAILRIVAPQVQALGRAYGGEIAVKTAAAVAETAVAVGAAVVTAGAAAGMLGARAGAAGARAAATSGGTRGAPMTGGGSAGAASPGGGGTGGPTAGSGAGPRDGGDPGGRGGQGGAGASTVGASPAAPRAGGSRSTGAGQRANSGTAPPERPAPTLPAGGQDPAQARGGSGALRRDNTTAVRRNQAAAQAAAQASQAVSNSMSRTTREALNDADETIGGKHG